MVIGRDILIEGGDVRIAPEALRGTESGVSIGTIPVKLEEIGSLDAPGNVLAIARTGALVTGRFDLATCAGSGDWTNGGLTGTWQTD